MQVTFQIRPNLDAIALRWLSEFSSLYGMVQRKLYARIAKGDKPSVIKPEFCKTFQISSRQFNAIKIDLEGKISSTVELLKLRRTELKHQISACVRSIKRIEKIIEPSPKKVIAPKKMAGLLKQVFGKNRRLSVLIAKLILIEKRLDASVPGICFGSRKLFNQQFNLEQSGYGSDDKSFDRWKKDWTASRSSQFFLVGSKDETSGNQSCKASVKDGLISLLLKMPDALISKGAPAFLAIDGIKFAYGHDKILEAMRDKVALSYRFCRDDGSPTGWRIFVSTDTRDAVKTSVSAVYGAIGIDFNADHLAWSEVDRHGNMIDFGRVSIAMTGKSTDQREAILSDALDVIFNVALERKLGISIEDLDFSKKKTELRSMGVKRARMLSGLAYSKFRQLAQAKASRKGVVLHIVDPAYTSVAGAIKYAPKLGRTVHQAAAGVIARRAQGITEKLPRVGAQRAPLMGRIAALTLPVRNVDENANTSWAKIRKCLTQHCAEQVRLRKKPSFKKRSMHLLRAGTKEPKLRESGKLLARRNDQFPDVPY